MHTFVWLKCSLNTKHISIQIQTYYYELNCGILPEEICLQITSNLASEFNRV